MKYSVKVQQIYSNDYVPGKIKHCQNLENINYQIRWKENETFLKGVCKFRTKYNQRHINTYYSL